MKPSWKTYPSAKILALVAVVILIFVFGLKALPILQKVNEPSVISPAAISLPANELDATINIPQTRLTLSYPQKGFYGLGADVTKFDSTNKGGVANSISINPVADYDIEKGSEYITVTASRSQNELTSGETLDKFLTSRNPQSIEAQYAQSGKYETLGGREYFVFKTTENVSIWTAYTVSDSNIVSITMAYKPTPGTESMAADKNNEQLFRDILSHVLEK